MQTFMTLLMLLATGFILWMLYQTVKKNPGAFSSVNINKSIFTLGILALILIGFIAALVLLLKMT